MKSFGVFLLMALVVGVGAGGCSSGVSPVVEYNNAIQALEADLKLKSNVEQSIKSTSDPKLKKELIESLPNIERNIERLQNKIKRTGPSI